MAGGVGFCLTALWVFSAGGWPWKLGGGGDRRGGGFDVESSFPRRSWVAGLVALFLDLVCVGVGRWGGRCSVV